MENRAAGIQLRLISAIANNASALVDFIQEKPQTFLEVLKKAKQNYEPFIAIFRTRTKDFNALIEQLEKIISIQAEKEKNKALMLFLENVSSFLEQGHAATTCLMQAFLEAWKKETKVFRKEDILSSEAMQHQIEWLRDALAKRVEQIRNQANRATEVQANVTKPIRNIQITSNAEIKRSYEAPEIMGKVDPSVCSVIEDLLKGRAAEEKARKIFERTAIEKPTVTSLAKENIRKNFDNLEKQLAVNLVKRLSEINKVKEEEQKRKLAAVENGYKTHINQYGYEEKIIPDYIKTLEDERPLPSIPLEFEKEKSSAEDKAKEENHYSPALFSPVPDPLDEIEMAVMLPEEIKLKVS